MLTRMRLDIPQDGGEFFIENIGGYITRLFTLDGEVFTLPEHAAYSLVDAEPAAPGWYVEPAPPEPPPPAVEPPAPIISRRQFYTAAALSGFITMDEALAALAGTIPTALLAVVSGLEDATHQFIAKGKLIAAVDFDINDPLVGVVALSMGLTDEQIAEFWRLAGTL